MIEYKNVALCYTEKDVLRDVNLQIEDGEFMVLGQVRRPCSR